MIFPVVTHCVRQALCVREKRFSGRALIQVYASPQVFSSNKINTIGIFTTTASACRVSERKAHPDAHQTFLLAGMHGFFLDSLNASN